MLVQGDYILRHNQAAKFVHRELAVKCGLSKGNPKYEPKSVLESPNFELYYDRSLVTDRTIHEKKPDMLIRHKTSK